MIEIPKLLHPIPDQYYPSDHVSLIAKFHFTSDSSIKTLIESDTSSCSSENSNETNDSDSESDLGMDLELNIF